jgi:hypothetical protein
LLRDHVAPCFFRLYPQGRIAVLRYAFENDAVATLMRVLYAATQTPLPEIVQGNFKGLRTLSEWHLSVVTDVGPLLVNFFNYLFYPFIAGYRGGPPGLDFLFLFEPPEKYSPDPYPRNWLAVASSLASFGHERFDAYAVLRDFRGSEGELAAHQRLQHTRCYNLTERLDLLHWYLDRVIASFTNWRMWPISRRDTKQTHRSTPCLRLSTI